MTNPHHQIHHQMKQKQKKKQQYQKKMKEYHLNLNGKKEEIK